MQLSVFVFNIKPGFMSKKRAMLKDTNAFSNFFLSNHDDCPFFVQKRAPSSFKKTRACATDWVECPSNSIFKRAVEQNEIRDGIGHALKPFFIYCVASLWYKQLN